MVDLDEDKPLEPISIVKSKNDDRSYEYLKLGNQMRILLVSDRDADKSAACMFVRSGSLNDPEDPMGQNGEKLDGMAHFCEHMLFLGTKKYSEENHYQNFVQQNGGDSNAATGEEYTYFYYDINGDKFEESLDIFSQFFKEPLFTESATEREMNAIENEYQMNISEETVATDQLEKSHIAAPGSIVNRFLIGNLETLKKPNIIEELKKYYEANYSSNRMSLVLVGNQPIDELKRMAE